MLLDRKSIVHYRFRFVKYNIAFYYGRRVSTVFEKEGYTKRRNATTGHEETIDEEQANTTAIGHFEPYRTHDLQVSTQRSVAVARQTARESVGQFRQARDLWQEDRPGSKIEFGGSILERTTNSAGRNPYLVISVDPGIIADHNDISNPRIVEFVKQLILISSHPYK